MVKVRESSLSVRERKSEYRFELNALKGQLEGGNQIGRENRYEVATSLSFGNYKSSYLFLSLLLL